MRYTFEVVSRQVTRKLPCRECGKTLSRTFRCECTVNPFNKGPDGEMLGREEVAKQSLASAERQADAAEAEGVVCQTCADAPQREALLAFADGTPLPERSWGNPTDILLDRGNIEEVRDRSPCPHCEQDQWKLIGYRLTDKGQRMAEKLRSKLAA